MRAVYVALFLCLDACAVYDARTSSIPPVTIPGRYSAPVEGAPLPERWWTALEDPDLTALIDAVLAQSLDLRAAWARLDQARAVARAQAAGGWPQVSADAGVGTSRQPAQFPGQDTTRDQFTLGVAASYEIDLWGKVASRVRGADMDVEASRDDLETAATSLAAQVAETWFLLIEQRAQREVLDEQMEVNRTFLRLVQLRFGQGQVSASDVLQQQVQLASVEAQVPLVESRIEVLAHQLAVLLGRPPRTVVAPARADLPSLPPPPGTGVPADLLRRRPDLRAAERRVTAADQRVGAAVADRFPALTIGGRIGLQSFDITEFLTSWLYSLTAGLAGPIVDGGRRGAEVDRARAVVQELLASYGKVTLNALLEVENAFVQEREQRRFIAALDRQLGLARATLREARSRFAAGLSDYLPVLTALRSLQQAELSRVTAARQLLSYRVQAYRALGGTWTRDLERPAPVADEEKTP